MSIVVDAGPLAPADIAKPIPTPASHVVAPCDPLNYKFALLALPVQ